MRHFLRTGVSLPVLCTALALGGLLAGPAAAQVGPPDLSVCDAVTCETLDDSICDPGGFSVSLTGFTPASTQNSGVATYTYAICSPAAGICNGIARPGAVVPRQHLLPNVEAMIDRSYGDLLSRLRGR